MAQTLDWNERRKAEHEQMKHDHALAQARRKAFHDAAERGDWKAANRVLEEIRRERAVAGALASKR